MVDALLADTTNGLQTVHYQLAELERATTSFNAIAIASDIERALDGVSMLVMSAHTCAD